MGIEYSKEFIERVKKWAPDNKELHRKLDHGSGMVGTILRDLNTGYVYMPELVKVKDSPEQIQELINRYEEGEKLLSEWRECPVNVNL
jgi:hypothetical protein